MIYAHLNRKRLGWLAKSWLAIFLILLLTACSEEVTSTSVPPTATPGATAVPPTTGVATPPTATQNPDPVQAPTPEVTFPSSPAATVTPTPEITPGGYGPLPTPPATINPTAVAFSDPTLPKGSLVVGTATGLYVVNSKDNSVKLLAGKASYTDPKVSPDGLHVAAFRQDPISRVSQFGLVDLTGNFKAVNFDNGGATLAVSWSPDSKTLALTRATDTNNDGLTDEFDQATLILYDVASAKQQSLGEGGWASWSLDGMRIAYIIPGPTAATLDPTTRQPGRGPNAIAVYNNATKAKRTLLESKSQSIKLGRASFGNIPADTSLDLRYFKAVTWHPDSQHLTASADVTGPNGVRAGVILILTVDDTTPKVLTAAGDAAGFVGWSADGKNLAFETEPQYPVTSRSATLVALLNEATFNSAAPVKTLLGSAVTRSETHRPAFSPDSQHLAYLESDNAILILADVTGKNPRALLSGCLGFDWF